MSERRQYVRMRTVFPVELEVFDEAGRKTSPHLLQAFTSNVSAGGLCVELKCFQNETEEIFNNPNSRLVLSINPPFSRHPIKAIGKIAWLIKQDKPFPPRYFIGVAYTEIEERSRARIVRYAKRLIWIPRAALVVGLGLLISIGGFAIRDYKLVKENKELVQELFETTKKKSAVSYRLYEMQKKKVFLESALEKSQSKLKSLEQSLASLSQENVAQKDLYEKQLAENKKRTEIIQSEIRRVEEGQTQLKTTYESMRAETRPTVKVVLRQMYEWVQAHQNLKTGLVASFEGDNFLEDWAFTYDQSLAAQMFLLFNDKKRTEAILSFYALRAQRGDGAFYNAYNTVDGQPTESTIHVGPNIWIGIAALQYEYKERNGLYLPLARQIGDWVISMQDYEGGLKGGPNVGWYSTEHNLDAYAFFNMLYQLTNDEKYSAASSQILQWIKKYAYSLKGTKINRGKGDATIATDTFSWSVAAIGPDKLVEMGFDPEGIIEYAEENCTVSVNYRAPKTQTVTTIKGFDFAKAQHMGRGGIVSTEWTSQMIVTYRILSKQFERLGDANKAALYRDKSNFYLNELLKLVITSPSRTGQGRGCLPYASHDSVDTGHGWRTPQGQRTGSVAGTVYGMFAWVGYNPFSFSGNLDEQSEA